jgi:intracellular sulfur oxidation DsrE/DsrF family protein
MSRKGYTALLLALAVAPLMVLGQARAASPKRHGKVVLVGLTGPEDLPRLTAPYRHALIMKKTGRLESVAIVIYGKAVKGLSKEGSAPLDALLEEVHAANIPVYVCEHALAKAGIALKDVRPEATPVPSGAAKIAELVSQGFSPLQY